MSLEKFRIFTIFTLFIRVWIRFHYFDQNRRFFGLKTFIFRQVSLLARGLKRFQWNPTMIIDTVFTRMIVFPCTYQDKNTAVCDTRIQWTFYYKNFGLFLWWNFCFPISDLNNFDLILNSKIYRNRTDIRTSIWCLYLFRFW